MPSKRIFVYHPESTWILEMLVFEGRRKPDYLEKILSEQDRELKPHKASPLRKYCSPRETKNVAK